MPRRYYRRKTFSKYLSTSLYLDSQQKLLGRLTKFSVGLSKLISTAPEEIFGAKRFFRIEIFLSSISEFQLMIPGLLAKYRKSHQNCILGVHRNILARNWFWEEKFITFGLSAEKNSNFWWDLLWWMSKNSFYVSRGRNFSGNRVLRKKIIHCLFRSWEWMFQTFEQKFRAESLKLRFTSPVDQFEENFFLKCYVSLFLPDFEQEVSNFLWRVFLAQLSNRLFTFPKGFFSSNFFLESGLHFQWLQAKKVRVLREKL